MFILAVLPLTVSLPLTIVISTITFILGVAVGTMIQDRAVRSEGHKPGGCATPHPEKLGVYTKNNKTYKLERIYES